MEGDIEGKVEGNMEEVMQGEVEGAPRPDSWTTEIRSMGGVARRKAGERRNGGRRGRPR